MPLSRPASRHGGTLSEVLRTIETSRYIFRKGRRHPPAVLVPATARRARLGRLVRFTSRSTRRGR